MKTLTDADYVKFIGNQESQFITNPTEFREATLKRLRGEIDKSGERLPWSKTHDKVRLREGEVSIWGGYNGHGKSMLLGMVTAWSLKTKTWLIASMEMKPEATLHRMIRQVSGCRDVSDDFGNRFMDWTDNKLWIYDQLDTVKPQRIIGMIHYAANELGIKHIVIDSLMKCGIATDDGNAQKDFVDRLCWAAKTHNCHIHLVAHMRKGQAGEYQMPGKHDIRGAGEITDLVDNVFIVWRNKDKEDKEREGQPMDDTIPDALLGVVKQRHGEWEGNFALWFNKESQQYVSRADRTAMPYRYEA